MKQSIDHLMQEHRLIEQVLGALGTWIERLQKQPALPREDLARFARFFRDFADKCHHGKEEDRLFVKMTEFGFPKEYGPLGVMLAEHEAGRTHVRALAVIGARTGPLTTQEIAQAIEHATEFIPLLLGHIQKEDNILYPMAQQAIPAAEWDQLNAGCLAFEQETVGPGEIQKLHALAQDLITAYPPDPAFNAHPACVGCH